LSDKFNFGLIESSIIHILHRF